METHLHVMPFEKVFSPNLSMRFAARELQHGCTAASCSHRCKCSNTDVLTNISKAERVDHLNQSPSQSIISSSRIHRAVGQVLNLSDNLISLAGRLVPASTIFTVKKGFFVFRWKLSGFPIFQNVPIVFVLSQNKNEKSLALSFCTLPLGIYTHW